MKLISQFKNRYNNITYKTYETQNGIKVVHLDNPATIDFNFTILFKAGSCYETKEGVPHGTAHFLEHMLFNPNGIFKNKSEIDRFEQGSIDKPDIYTNANTTRKNIYFTCNSNEKGYLRVLERLEYLLTFSKKRFSTQMEKERGIILAEKSRKLKKEKDPYLLSLDFFFKNIQEEFTYDVLGEIEDIKKITVDDLEKYYSNRFVTGNCVFAIQSKGELKHSVVKKLEEISKKVKHSKTDNFRDIEIKNRYRVGTFTDDRTNGINISFIYFDKVEKKTDYKKFATEYIYGRLIDWLAFDILREKLSLIYDFSVFRAGGLAYGYDTSGFRFVSEKEKVKKTLEELHFLLYTKAFTFLKSKKGKEWFDDVISTYIFPRTTKFNEELAEGAATSFLEGTDIFNTNISIREAKKIMISDIKKYLEERLRTPPHIWVESDMSEKEMRDLIKESPFEKEVNISYQKK